MIIASRRTRQPISHARHPKALAKISLLHFEDALSKVRLTRDSTSLITSFSIPEWRNFRNFCHRSWRKIQLLPYITTTIKWSVSRPRNSPYCNTANFPLRPRGSNLYASQVSGYWWPFNYRDVLMVVTSWKECQKLHNFPSVPPTP